MTEAAGLKLAIIAAVGRNGELGFKNRLLWHVSADLQHFKKLTMGAPMIMGRKTFESLPGVLPGRPHIVLGRGGKPQDEVIWVESIGQALVHAGNLKSAHSAVGIEAWVIGGAQIYAAFLERVERLYLTRIDATAQADVWFPAIDEKQWRLVAETNLEVLPGQECPAARVLEYRRA